MRTSVVVALLAGLLVSMPGAARADDRPRDLVNVFTGTTSGQPDFGTGGGAGNTFPGVVAPFGMLQWSPDTMPSLDNFTGRYTYGDDHLRGFSLTHMSGAGCANFGDVPILPVPGRVESAPIGVSSSEYRPELLPAFDHAHESAGPGRYAVTLDPGTPDAIRSALTARTRAGAGRFTFSGGRGSFLVNAGGSSMADTLASVHVDPARREISGTSESGAFCYQDSRYAVHFVLRFDRPFAASGTWTKQVLAPGSTSAQDVGPDPRLKYQQLAGLPKQLPGDPSGTAEAGAYATFDTSAHHRVGVRVGLSFVSVDHARDNLRAEVGGRSFRAVRRAAEHTWDAALHRITVRGNTRRERRTFDTMLYHALIHPSTLSDADGSYPGMDGRVHRTRRTKYSSFSGWDVYRSQVPLLAMVWPRRAADLAQSMVLDARQSGWLPKWSVGPSQTGMMVGDPAPISIATTDAMGARRFDHRAALAAMLKAATETGQSSNSRYVERPGLLDYRQLGYIPRERDTGVYSTFVDPALVWGPTATTLEYAVADAATAHFARAVCRRSGRCDPRTAAVRRQSRQWRHVINPATRRAQSRSADGSWFDQSAGDGTGFVEGNGAQYTWLVPQDPAGLFRRLGGQRTARRLLDRFFLRLNAGPASPHAFLGNEPTSGAPWLYHWLGRPARTQSVIDRALTRLYSPTPGGIPGNDDLGQMAAWYVTNAIGLYPSVPGTDVLTAIAPRFRQVVLRLPHGPVVLRNSPGSPLHGHRVVRSLRLDGQPWARSWVRFARLRHGAVLDFTVGRHGDWGRARSARPPSYAGR